MGKQTAKIVLMAVLLFCTSFSVEKKTYWLCYALVETNTKTEFVRSITSEIVEANTYKEADKIFRSWIKYHKSDYLAKGKIIEDMYSVRQIWPGMIGDAELLKH